MAAMALRTGKDEIAANAAVEVTNCRRDISFFEFMNVPPSLVGGSHEIIAPDPVIVYPKVPEITFTPNFAVSSGGFCAGTTNNTLRWQDE
jgi:hypothetical protein